MAHAAPSEPGPHTWDDFIGLDEDDLRELIDGELVEVEVPKGRHERICALLAYFLEGWARAGGGGRVLGSGYKIRIGARRGVMPDVQFYRAENRALEGQDDGLVEGRPDLVVEVVSPSSRRYDRVTKLHWYASIGVPEYWILEPDARSLERLALVDGRYVIADAVTEGATFAPSSFEGLAIALDELWRS